MGTKKPTTKAHEFPQLREITDVKRLNQVMNKHMQQPDVHAGAILHQWRIKRVYYKPGDECRITLTAKYPVSKEKKEQTQLFFGKLFPERNGARVFRQLKRDQLRAPSAGPSVTYIARWDMVLWAYPNDPELIGLPQLLDKERVLQEARQYPEKFGLKVPPVAVRMKQTKYVPGKRCGFIFTMKVPNPQHRNQRKLHRVFGKVYENQDGERAYKTMQQLWDSPDRKEGHWKLPRPFSYDKKNRILWQEVVYGSPLAKYVASLKNLPEVFEKIGSTLGALHNTPVSLPEEMNFDFQLWELDKAVKAVNENYPGIAERVNSLSRALHRHAGQMATNYATTIHASFKMSHIFESDGGITLIDFDGANHGDPGYDVGRFLAHFIRMKIEKKIPTPLANAAVEQFCAAYNRTARQPLSQKRINWFVACHLISSEIYKTVKRMDTANATAILDAANQLCNGRAGI